MNAEFDAPKEVAQVQSAGDSSALSNAQADSFKGFDNFSSIKNSMSDSSSNSLPGLELVDSNSQPSDTNQNRGPENQNPGDTPQNPNPNGGQNPGDGERNDDPRSKNQPGSDPSEKQLDGANGQKGDAPKAPGQENIDGPLQPPADGDDGRSKDHDDNRSKPNPADDRQKELDGGQSTGDHAQAGDQGKPGQPGGEDNPGGSKEIRDDGSKPNPEDPGQAKQLDPNGKPSDAQGTGDHLSASAQSHAPSGGGNDGSTPVKPDVMPKQEQEYAF